MPTHVMNRLYPLLQYCYTQENTFCIISLFYVVCLSPLESWEWITEERISTTAQNYFIWSNDFQWLWSHICQFWSEWVNGDGEGGCYRGQLCSGQGVVVQWMFPTVEDFPHQSLDCALSFMLQWGARQIDKRNYMNPL